MNLQLARAVLSDTEELPKPRFNCLILKAEKHEKCRSKGVVPDCHLNTLEALISLVSAALQLNLPGLHLV